MTKKIILNCSWNCGEGIVVDVGNDLDGLVSLRASENGWIFEVEHSDEYNSIDVNALCPKCKERSK